MQSCRGSTAALQQYCSTTNSQSKCCCCCRIPVDFFVCRKTLGAAAAVRARASYKISLVQVYKRAVGAQAKCACLCAQHLVVQRVRNTLFCFLFFFCWAFQKRKQCESEKGGACACCRGWFLAVIACKSGWTGGADSDEACSRVWHHRACFHCRKCRACTQKRSSSTCQNRGKG